MRPNGLESIRAIQSALAEAIAPELTTPFAQDAAQSAADVLESLAANGTPRRISFSVTTRRLRQLLKSCTRRDKGGTRR